MSLTPLAASTTFSRLLKTCALGLPLFVLSQSVLAQIEQEPVGPSYHERWRVFKPGSGTKQVDPNVYVYSPDFAKRFQMPEEWSSTELNGVDAVAFRVMPSYSSCGWGGGPKACNTNEVRCEMDLYFDHKANPLPWDERYPEVRANRYSTSVHFIPAPIRESRLPKRPNDHSFFGEYQPFVDPNTGKGMWWEGGYWENNGGGGIHMSMVSYDREIFKGIAFLTMSGGCGEPATAIWLTANNGGYREKTKAYKLITLPQDWRLRVKQALHETKERAEAFFKREGEKAVKALRESPKGAETFAF